MSQSVYLALGSNQGNSKEILQKAIEKLDDIQSVSVFAISSCYMSKPWGEPNQPDFVNMVIGVETTLAPETLLSMCFAVERSFGRVRTKRWAPRTLDIDMIYYAGLNLKTETLTLPHPRAHTRDFVLLPLQEITSSEFIFSGKALAQWISELEETFIYKKEALHQLYEV